MAETPFEQDKTDNTSLTEQELYWHRHYCRWQQSDLSLAAYARSQGLVENTFYGWHAKLKKRGLARPEPAPTVFHRVAIKPTETPTVIEETDISLRFRLPNGINGELARIKPDHITSLLETLARVRL